MSAILSAQNLDASYGATQVLFGVNFSVEQGGITTILGANGAGKTTLLRAISGMIGTRGEITFLGQRIESKATEDIVRMGLGHVPDGRGTFTHLTTEENLRLGAYTRRDKTETEKDFERVFSYFPRLKERHAQQAGTLSGGEQQMLAIGRALMLKPKLLVLDEPSFGLAPVIVQEIFCIMAAINKQDGVSILLRACSKPGASLFPDWRRILPAMNPCGRLILVTNQEIPTRQSPRPSGERARVRGQPEKSRPQLLRTSATEAERKIWYFLRNRQFEKFKFRRQHPIDVYIVDFVCLIEKLIIELDGGQHTERVPYDERRTKALSEKGYRLLRFWNNDVMRKTEAVLEAILTELNAGPSPLPSPRDGERG
jgi:branched-chain amino acid transport system ATP-binding protein